MHWSHVRLRGNRTSVLRRCRFAHAFNQGAAISSPPIARVLTESFSKMVQNVCHRLARNSHRAGKWIVEFQDYKKCAGDRERAGD